MVINIWVIAYDYELSFYFYLLSIRYLAKDMNGEYEIDCFDIIFTVPFTISF